MSDAIGEFSLYVFFPDDTYERELSFVDVKTAVETAKRLTTALGARLGTTRQVMITDGEDFCVFLWRYGEGIVFPTPEMRAGARASHER